MNTKISIVLSSDDSTFLEKETKIIQNCMRGQNIKHDISRISTYEELLHKAAHSKQALIIFNTLPLNDLQLKIFKEIKQFSTIKISLFLCVDKKELSFIELSQITSKNTTRFYTNDILNGRIKEIRNYNHASLEKKILSFGDINDLVYVESKLHDLIFHYKSKKMNIKGKLSDVEEILYQDKFKRSHQSYLINTDYISKIKRYEVTLYDGSSIPISKSKYEALKLN